MALDKFILGFLDEVTGTAKLVCVDLGVLLIELDTEINSSSV